MAWMKPSVPTISCLWARAARQNPWVFVGELKRDFDLRAEEFVEQAKKRLREKLRTSRGRSGLEVASEFSAEMQTKRQSALADLERVMEGIDLHKVGLGFVANCIGGYALCTTLALMRKRGMDGAAVRMAEGRG
jgi:hypothetical protein